MIYEAHYETSILWSQTRVLNSSDPVPTIEEILAANSAED